MYSEDYKQQLEQLHSTTTWGSAGKHWIPTVLSVCFALNVTSILDYGAGKAHIQRIIYGIKPKWTVQSYDAGIPELNIKPNPADLVVCFDVLEHIEPAHLDAVLDHLKKLTKKGILLKIATDASKVDLPDGRNSHLIIESCAWWELKLREWWKGEGQIDFAEHKGLLVFARKGKK